MAINPKLKEAKQTLKETAATHKQNLKALTIAEKAVAKSAVWVAKAEEKVAKLSPAPFAQ